jgi:DNA-binding CsgD family transcriptional regulator/PAS domain-containing protein
MIGMEGISAQTLSDTIGAIYDCALDPERWRDTCRRMAELCESPAGGMCVHDMRNVQNDHLFEFGYQPEFFELLQKHYAQSPIAADGVVRDVGEVLTLGQICSDEELFQSRFYRDLLKPYGCLDFIGIIALRTGDRVAWVHASRMYLSPRYGRRDINLFQLFSPHVCRTLTISNALDIRTLRSEMLEVTLDGLAAGVYLARRDGRVVFMNAAAERQVKAGSALRILNNRLAATDLQAGATISKAIAEVDTDETEVGAAGHSLAIPDTNGAGYVATLLPLGRGRRQSIMAPFAASVAIFTQDPAQVPLMPGEAFARLYRLTGGELRVLLALAQGLGAKEAADMLGIGEPTVRTHLQRMFSKTRTSRQTQLLQLLQSSTPPTKAP